MGFSCQLEEAVKAVSIPEQVINERRSPKRAEIEKAFAKRGSIRMPRLDKNEYPPIPGMEGPFQFRDGRTLYYDPRKGRYYDRKTDMYLSRNDIPEDAQEMLAALVEVDGFDEYTVLTEAVLTKSLAPIFSKAMGVEMDKRQAKLVSNEFVQQFRKAVEQKLRDYSDEPETEGTKLFDFEDEFEYTPSRHRGISPHQMVGPGYYDEIASVSGKAPAVTKMSLYVSMGIGVPDAVDLMAGTIKRFFGNDAFISARRNLARALVTNQKLFMRLLEEAVTTVYRSWKYGDLDTDAWNKEIIMVAGDDLDSRDEVDWNVENVGKYNVTLDRIRFDRKLKPVSSTAGPGSDVQVTFTSYWRLDWDEYPEIKANP